MLWFAVIAAGLGLFYAQSGGNWPVTLPQIGDPGAAASFSTCGWMRKDNCVIDGDTFRYEGQSIRIMDIDAPETHPPRCDHEAALGKQATLRLRELLSAGPFQMEPTRRDEDRYGRKLRLVTRDGRSLGDALVAEGLCAYMDGTAHAVVRLTGRAQTLVSLVPIVGCTRIHMQRHA